MIDLVTIDAESHREMMKILGEANRERDRLRVENEVRDDGARVRAS